MTSKRDKFPRFFFLTNDELIQILSQTRNAQAVQPFLNKCFDSIKRITFTEEKNSKEILGMMLLTRHNLHYYQELMSDMRAVIEAGTFAGFRAAFAAEYEGGDIEPI